MIEASSSTPRTISGLPASLPPNAHALLVRGGTAIALAIDEVLTIFEISVGRDDCAGREVETYELAGHACGLAQSELGILVALDREDRTALCLARDGDLTVVCEVRGAITALGASGAHAYTLSRRRS